MEEKNNRVRRVQRGSLDGSIYFESTEKTLERKERERIKDVVASRASIFLAMDKETKAAHNEEIDKLIDWWFKPLDVKLESGKYQGYTPLEILEKHPEDVMEAFSKAIVDHYDFPDSRDLHKIKEYCPGFKLSDEAAKIYQYEKEVYENLAWEEHLVDLPRERHLKDLDSLGEPSEGSSEDYNENLDLDQQHHDFYQG